MRSRLGILVTAAAMLAMPQIGLAEEDVNEQLKLMNERMSQMESQLQATQDELENSKAEVDRQSDVIEKAGLEDRDAKSGLAGFLYDTQFSGYVAASWNYNFTRPDASQVGDNDQDTSGGVNIGSMGITAPFHSNHNSFQVDGFFFSMMKPATSESRGGWGVDLTWGVQSDTWMEGGASADSFSNENGDMPHLFQAYVEYLVPVGSGVNVKGGRFTTPIGAESFRYDENWQITRGLLWSIQPINHTGLMFSGDCDCGIDWGIGLANSFNSAMGDADNQKTFIGTLGYNAETWSFHVNGLYGGDGTDTVFDSFRSVEINGPGTNKESVGLIDAVFAWDPTEKLSMWVNFDYWFTDNIDEDGSDRMVSSMTIYGIAAAARLAITERTGVSMRYEWLYFNDADLDFAANTCCMEGGVSYLNTNPTVFENDDQFGGDTRMWSLTGTVDHSLTDNLVIKAEVRWDQGWAQGTNDRFFIRRTDRMADDQVFSKENQVLGLIQMMYKF